MSPDLNPIENVWAALSPTANFLPSYPQYGMAWMIPSNSDFRISDDLPKEIRQVRQRLNSDIMKHRDAGREARVVFSAKLISKNVNTLGKVCLPEKSSNSESITFYENISIYKNYPDLENVNTSVNVTHSENVYNPAIASQEPRCRH